MQAFLIRTGGLAQAQISYQDDKLMWHCASDQEGLARIMSFFIEDYRITGAKGATVYTTIALQTDNDIVVTARYSIYRDWQGKMQMMPCTFFNQADLEKQTVADRFGFYPVGSGFGS